MPVEPRAQTIGVGVVSDHDDLDGVLSHHRAAQLVDRVIAAQQHHLVAAVATLVRDRTGPVAVAGAAHHDSASGHGSSVP